MGLKFSIWYHIILNQNLKPIRFYACHVKKNSLIFILSCKFWNFFGNSGKKLGNFLEKFRKFFGSCHKIPEKNRNFLIFFGKFRNIYGIFPKKFRILFFRNLKFWNFYGIPEFSQIFTNPNFEEFGIKFSWSLDILG